MFNLHIRHHLSRAEQTSTGGFCAIRNPSLRATHSLMSHPIQKFAAANCTRGLAHAGRPLFVTRPGNTGYKSFDRSVRPPRAHPGSALLSTTVNKLRDRTAMSPPGSLFPPNSMLNYKGNDYLGIDADLSLQDFKPGTPWGLAVYRTCYEDEAAWQGLVANLTNFGGRSFWPVDGQYMPGRHQLAIMNDRAQWDGADRVAVRDHFAQWARAEMERNMAEPEKDAGPKNRAYPPDHLDDYGPRYNVFGIVDDICIESMHRQKPLLMLVRRDWEPMTEEEMRDSYDGDIHEDFEDGWMVDHTEGPGGWIYTETSDYVQHYGHLENIDEWSDDNMFMYPSIVYGGDFCAGRRIGRMGLERSPGFWREEMAAKKKPVE
ncbi:hypothetical protein F5X68DRAFT_207193 [Plectosphaerella plurivora]|uniref:Uncharacterized protein n=1 Tax=Plectosphaerella plurivora TaxID=936078 RepID=A0A9P8VBH0_9PEZI|nr:hypothetical protein F5X68DRAFT_207193 [Plectosphaerella plurivora]